MHNRLKCVTGLRRSRIGQMIWRRSSLVKITLLVTHLGLSGCVTNQVNQASGVRKIAEDRVFVLYEVQAPHTYQDVANLANNDYVSVEQIVSVNGPRNGAGQIVAVPKQAVNASSFYVDGFRTVPVLCYHQFASGPQTSQQLEVSRQSFRAQLEYLRDKKFNVLSMPQLLEVLEGNRPIPPRAVVITIDDGYRSVYDVAWPILQEFQFPVTLYIYTDFVGGGRALTWAQLRQMQKSGYVDVQSHGKSHTSLSRIEQDDSEAAYTSRVRSELIQSRRILNERLGEKVWNISYPYGNSSDVVTNLLGESGYKLGFTVTRGENSVYVDKGLLHRTMIYNNHSLSDFKKIVDGFKDKNLR